MQTIGKLEKLLMEGKITEEEYKERKATYVETILEMYCLGILTKEQMQEKLNQQIRNGVLVSWENISRLRALSECQPGDIVEYVENREN